jgi:hypothetical protein
MSRTYEEFINDSTPAKTYCINDVHFYFDRKNISRYPVTSTTFAHSNCNCCTSRANKYCFLIGVDGPAFLSNIRDKNDGDENGLINNIRETIITSLKSDPNHQVFDIHVVRANSFPPVQAGIDSITGKPWEHFTIHPDKVTPDDLANQVEPLFSKYFPIIGARLEKLTMKGSIASTKIIYDELIKSESKIERVDHWKSVFEWVIGIQNYCEGKEYIHCNPKNKKEIEVYSITTGRFVSNETECVHKDYHQSDNIIDFIVMTDIDSIAREMNTRSNPDNYMVSQLARRMRKEKITSSHTVSLVWPGEFKDDLDIHVKWSHQQHGSGHIYYGNKHDKYNYFTCKLDFDANVTHGEKEPCENVSLCPGTFNIWVDNFTPRSNSDVPFTIIIHQEGNNDIIIERTWPKGRLRGNMMNIITHTFTPINTSIQPISDKTINRTNALNKKWLELFGNPSSIIPSTTDCDHFENIKLSNKSITPNVTNVNDAYMNMISRESTHLNGKKFLSDHIKNKIPDTLTGLFEYIKNGNHELSCDPRSFVPGYVTKIQTNTKVTKVEFSCNAYTEKFHCPKKPVIGVMGNSRFDESWFNTQSMNRNVYCNKFYKINGIWFMVLDNMCMGNKEEFPHSNGFYPVDLLSNVHDLRDRWAASNTIIDTITVSHNPMIGSFLTGRELEFTLNNSKIIVKNE